MRRTLAIIALFSAWLCANGALWNCVQVVAWGKMVHDYSRIMPLTQAVEKTFDGSAPCEICAIVDDVQQQKPAQQVAERSNERVLLACEVPEKFLVSVPDYSWPDAVNCTGLERTDPVPVRPPRV
ncbi:MAG: hypothetical protein K9M98_10875 [Cephaloticoccus sp.]|nr:hypothetical protein [Cephaloticoccus sp.]